MHTGLLVVRLILAAVFAVAAFAKLFDLAGSRAAVAGFGVPEQLASSLGTVLPFAELAVAGALLPAGSARYGAVGAAALLAAFAAAIGRSIARGEAPDCHCFGQLHSEPAGWRALGRNLVLGAGAIFVALAGWANPGPSAVRWIGRLHGAALVAFAGGIALAVLAVLTASALLALLRQNGRLLLAIDELESRLDAAGAPPAAVPHVGLPLGSPAPGFTLSGLYGETVTLESLTAADHSVMLLFTDPACGPCNALMPQISEWQREHARLLTIAVMTRGSADDNRSKVREHGIANVWLDDALEIFAAYQAAGTPGAVLIDATGRIASPVVSGADAISSLVAQAASGDGGLGGPVVPVVHVPAQPTPHAVPAPPTPLAVPAQPTPLAVPAQPTPLAVPAHPAPAPVPAPPPVPALGSNAPAIELLDLDGQPVALSDSERDTLVLFWNPGCGFCQRMLDDVRALEQSPPAGAPRLLFVSTGSVGDNEAQGIESPIALDPTFAAGTAFGSTGTPSGILVDRQGRVASGLAVGAPAVMALAAPPARR